MSLEILGVLLHRNASEITPDGGPKFDRAMIGTLARAFDENGFDRVLILQNSFAPDPFPIASYVAAITTRLSFMIAHRPEFIAPTMAARMLATLDNLSEGRVGVHVITGANDTELQCDGDFLTKEDRYRRSREYVEVMRRTWTADAPFDYRGDYYQVNRSLAELKPFRPGGIPVYWGGSSPLALQMAGECADVYAIGGLKPLAAMRETVSSIEQAAQTAGRTLRIQTSVRVILGDTEAAAFAEAKRVVDRLRAVSDEQQRKIRANADATSTGMRLDKTVSTTRGGSGRSELEQLGDGPEMLDKRLWTGITKASLDFVTPTLPPALVGTPEQVADALLDYYRMGISGFLIRGFDLLDDIAEHGRSLIPLLRDGAARIDAERAEPLLVQPSLA